MTARLQSADLFFVGLASIAVVAAVTNALPSESWQLLILMILVVLFGLPHGALDPLVARQSGLFNGNMGMLRFAAIYLVQAMSVLFFWLMLPGIALGLFLLMSAVHFSGDWKRQLPDWLRFFSGMAVVLAPLLFWQAEVTRLFSILTSEATASNLVPTLQPIAMICVAITTIALAYYRARTGRAGLEVAILIALAFLLPPLVFFAVYFCGLHSPRHTLEVIYGHGVSWREAIAVSVVFTILTLLGAAVFFVTGEAGTLDEKSVRVLFIGLAALTVPHMILLAKVARRQV